MKKFWKRSNSGGGDIREQSSPASGRPKLKSAFTDELRQSVHNLEKKREEKRSSRLSRFLGNSGKKESTTLSPLLSPRLLGGKEKLSIDAAPEPSDEAPRTPDGYATERPTLNQALAQGPPLPFNDQEAEKDHDRNSEREKEEQARSRRQQIRERQMKRRESKASIMESLHPPESIQEEEEEDLDDDDDGDDTEEFYTSMKVPAKSTMYAAPSRPPRISQALADELKQSIHGRDSKNADKRRKIKERIMVRRESQRQELMRSQASLDSFAADEVALPSKPAPAPKRGTRKSFADTAHSTDTFQASFSDDSQFQTKGINKDSSSSAMDDVSKDTEDSFFNERFKKQDDKKAQQESAQNNKAMEALRRQVEDLKTESKDLRKQLSAWQDKASKSSQRQSQERLKFEASNEMIAKARVDLTKSLNENAMLRRKLYDIEQAGAQKDMKVRSLTGTIDVQAEKVDELALKLRDVEEELRFNVQDKQRLEEELSVLMAAQDGQDIGEVLRRLEQEKATWFEDRERALEAKQIALDEENDRILQRERQKYRQEADDLLELESKSKQREEEQQRLQDAIDKQLKEMREANRDLQEQLQAEHNENRMETKKKDSTISMLEQEVSKLRRKLAASQLREQEHNSRRSEMDSTHEELDIAKKQNRLLEKQIKKLKSDAQSGKGDWKEVILPGYKNLRGVTFGSPSDDLAGFLTILVEDQRAKQKQAVSNLQKEIKKYLKEPNAKALPKKKAVSKGKGTKVKTLKKGANKKVVAAKKKTITKGKAKAKATSKGNGKVNGSAKSTTKGKKGDKESKKKSTKKKEEETSEAELSNEYEWGEGSSESASEKPKKGNKAVKVKKTKATTKKKVKYQPKKAGKEKVSKKRGVDAGGDVNSWEDDTTAQHAATGKKKTKKKNKKKGEITKAKLKSQKRATIRNVSMIESALVGMKPKKAADEVSLVVMKAEHRVRERGRSRSRLPSVVPPQTIVLQ